jgi:hypothetical protein
LELERTLLCSCGDELFEKQRADHEAEGHVVIENDFVEVCPEEFPLEEEEA